MMPDLAIIVTWVEQQARARKVEMVDVINILASENNLIPVCTREHTAPCKDAKLEKWLPMRDFFDAIIGIKNDLISAGWEKEEAQKAVLLIIQNYRSA